MNHAKAFGKPRPKLLTKREGKAAVAAMDRVENAKVKARSQGRCEIRADMTLEGYRGPWATDWRCSRRASQIHHLRSGIGIRNSGDSIKFECKLHVCDLHHAEIHGHVLKPVNEADRYLASTVRYEKWSRD